MEPFRTAPQASETASVAPEPLELGDAGNQEKAVGEKQDLSAQSELEKWEIQHGKYGLQYLGIEEIGKEFPYSADFSVLDSFIKEKMKESGYSQTPEKWQSILAEIENEIGSKDLNAIDRLKKIAQYVKVMKKIGNLTKLKDSYRNISSGFEL